MVNTKITKSKKEEIKMKKYIVEVPEPKKGQKASSGGIRENGKIASQYKNPVPYKEPTLLATVTKRSNTELIRQEQVRTRRSEAERQLIGIAWQELGEPLLRAGFRKLGDMVIDKLERTSRQRTQCISSPNPVVIDAEAEEVETIFDDDKIIQFPKREVI